MPHIGPYHVERGVRRNDGSHTYVQCYHIERTGEGVMVRGDDLVFMNFLCDLLNDDEHGSSLRRDAPGDVAQNGRQRGA